MREYLRLRGNSETAKEFQEMSIIFKNVCIIHIFTYEENI